MAEMRRIVKSPEKRDLRDALLPRPWIAQVLPTVFQPLRTNPIRHRGTAPRKQAVQVTHRNSHRRRNLRGTKGRFRQMLKDVLKDTRDRFSSFAKFSNGVSRGSQADGQ